MSPDTGASRRRHGAAAALVALLLATVALAACGGGSGEETGQTVPAAGDGTIFGYNEAITPADSEGDDLIAESGAAFVRIPMAWATLEPTEGARNWEPYDAINDELESVGLRPLWTLTSAPCWAADVNCETTPPGLGVSADHIDAYADLAAEVADRYPDAIGLEIWNEPNIPNFWRPTPDADLYRQLLSASADAVHEGGSDVPVVMAGPSPTTTEQVAEDPEKIGFVDFITTVMQGPDAPDVDAIGLHPYSLLQVGTDPVDESVRLYEEGRDAAAAVAPGIPVWVTEVGLTTAGQYAITPEEQADGLERIVKAFADDGVPVISIHRFFDQLDPPLKFEEGFGVVESDRATKKPAFCSAADAIGAECTP